MDILKFPDPRLLEGCKDVIAFGDNLKAVLELMWDTMIENDGVGLAANQVGILVNMFVMKGPSEERLYIVNPVVRRKSVASAKIREGCLSAPGEFVVVPSRSDWIQIEFQDETGKLHKRMFNDIYAICVQHEMEHLEGKAFIGNKSIPKDTRKELKSKWGLK